MYLINGRLATVAHDAEQPQSLLSSDFVSQYRFLVAPDHTVLGRITRADAAVSLCTQIRLRVSPSSLGVDCVLGRDWMNACRSREKHPTTLSPMVPAHFRMQEMSDTDRMSNTDDITFISTNMHMDVDADQYSTLSFMSPNDHSCHTLSLKNVIKSILDPVDNSMWCTSLCELQQISRAHGLSIDDTDQDAMTVHLLHHIFTGSCVGHETNSGCRSVCQCCMQDRHIMQTAFDFILNCTSTTYSHTQLTCIAKALL
ncbi:hypothetical protein K474DRAFT_1771461, partial [Panus rudis PR-1116 ss-1]